MLISSEKWKIRWDDSFKILDLNSLVFKRRWRCENAWARHIWSTHSSFRVHVNKACVSWPWPHFHGLLTSFNIRQVLQLGHDSLYKSWRVHFYQVCVSWPWPHFQSTDCLIFVIWLVSPLPYNIGSPLMVHTYLIEDTYLWLHLFCFGVVSLWWFANDYFWLSWV
jgi:hypothetical protein